jgi:hypothetical protein
MNSYVKFSNIKGNKLVQLKTGKSKNGIYNIQYINNCITLRSEKCSQISRGQQFVHPADSDKSEFMEQY